MTALFLVVPLALLISAIAVYAFVWSVNHGQLDDLETPALRMLEDDQQAPGKTPGLPAETPSSLIRH